jgi:sporulation protein YlmC with PRC-barrel domain
MLEYPSLRYIAASQVESGVTDLAGFEVLTSTGERLGELDGLIVDPPERSIRFAVVGRGARRGRHQVLVPLSLAQLDMERRAIQVDLENESECPEFEADAFPAFSRRDSQSALLAARFTLPM